MNLVFIIPVLVVLGALFLWWSGRRTRGRRLGPDHGSGVAGRPDEDEPIELTGPEEHKRRR